jgi:hypothetical protein
VAFAAAIFYLWTSYWVNAITPHEFILEIPSAFWGIIALYLPIRYKDKCLPAFLSGIAAALSVLTKQYGIGFLFLSMFILLHNRQKWKLSASLLSGFALPLLIMFFLLPEMSTIFLGNGYGTNQANGTSGVITRALQQLFAGYAYLLIRLPLLALALPLVFVIPKDKRQYGWACLLGLGGFMLQFVFAYMPHYILYVIPFASIYILLAYASLTANWHKWVMGLLILMSLAFSVKRDVSRMAAIDTSARDRQIALAATIRQIAGPGAHMFIADLDLIPFYYLTALPPVNNDYSFGFTVDERFQLKQWQDADYILSYDPLEKPSGNISRAVIDYMHHVREKIPLAQYQCINEETNKSEQKTVYLFVNNKLNNSQH